MRVYTFVCLLAVDVCAHIALTVDAKLVNDSDQFGTNIDSTNDSTIFTANNSVIHSSLSTSANVEDINEERFLEGHLSHLTEKSSESEVFLALQSLKNHLSTMDQKWESIPKIEDRVFKFLNSRISSQKLAEIVIPWTREPLKADYARRILARLILKSASIRREDNTLRPSLGSTPRGIYDMIHQDFRTFDRSLIEEWLRIWMIIWEISEGIEDSFVVRMNIIYENYDLISPNTNLLRSLLEHCDDFNWGRFKGAMMNIMKREAMNKDLIAQKIPIQVVYKRLKAAPGEENYLQWLRYCNKLHPITSRDENFYFTILEVSIAEARDRDSQYMYLLHLFKQYSKVSSVKHLSDSMYSLIEEAQLNWRWAHQKKSLEDVYLEIHARFLMFPDFASKHIQLFRYINVALEIDAELGKSISSADLAGILGFKQFDIHELVRLFMFGDVAKVADVKWHTDDMPDVVYRKWVKNGNKLSDEVLSQGAKRHLKDAYGSYVIRKLKELRGREVTIPSTSTG
ncbi:uncharacterized protein PHALS_06211 [Plasmopara halstedii]|uniref:RxLR-like protein n=1 Tax=Plasmopara halstedii TaxID=4781 RepID=A0A0P1B2V7_PLAHL|nr:uncharacterized protein PHALS_06211 [Plasmopara halstedii]CEG48386.1 hypothetical protein PHALS_06211 [Plasmopara halstedii]|eukprot:XP_024584755.1 hypothetical protein PHALS_06211 [Plasmopara halstedii]